MAIGSVVDYRYGGVAMLALWLAAVIDPVGHFYGVRYFSYGIFLLVFGLQLVNSGLKVRANVYQVLFVFVFSIVLPLYGTVVYAIHGVGAPFLDTSYFASAILAPTTFIYGNRKSIHLGILSAMFACRFLVILIILNSVLIILFHSWSMASVFNTHSVAVMGFRSYAGVQIPYIYFLACPLLILLCAWDFKNFLERRSLLSFFIFFVTICAMFLTGTRGSAASAVLVVGMMLFLKQGAVLQKSMIASALLVLAVYLSINYAGVLDKAFSSSDPNNRIKIGYLGGYANILNNFYIFWFGQGFNAASWSTTFQDMLGGVNASKTELTYLELFRVFGAPLAILTIIFLLASWRRALRDSEIYLGAAFGVIVINAAVNPYLFSSNGMLPLALIIATFGRKGEVWSRVLPFHRVLFVGVTYNR